MDTTDAPQIIEHVKKSLTYTPFCTRWIPSSARFVVLGQNPKATGRMQIYELSGGTAKCIHECEKPAGFKCGTFGASTLQDRHLATGDFAGKLNIWDLTRTEKPLYNVQAHAACVNVIDGCGGQNIGYGACELVTGSRDGCVRVWDPRVKEAVLSLEPDDDTARDCWAVAFGNSYNDDERCIAAGYDNGDVKLFDLRTNSVRWDTNVGNGVVSLEFDRKDIEMNKLAVTTLESRFRLFDMRTFHETEGYSWKAVKAHKSTVWLARHLPQNRDVWMTCGGNGGLNVYRYSYPLKRQAKDKDGLVKGVVGDAELLNSRMVSTQPIVSFNWSPDKEGLCVMASLDQAVRVCIVTKLDKY